MKKQDGPLFLFSFVLTLVTWLYVGSLFDTSKTQEFNVALTIEAKPGFVAVYPPETVTVVVTGSPTSMARLRPQDLRAVADARNFDRDIFNANVEVKGPKDLDLTYAPKYAEVRLNLEKETTKFFKVEFKNPGPDGISAVTLPEKVSVKGPASVVNRVTRAVIGYDQAKDRAEQGLEWKVELLSEENKIVTALAVDPPTVQVDPNALARAPRLLVVSPVTSGQPAAGFKVANIQVRPVSLRAEVTPVVGSSVSSLSTSPVLIDGAKADVVVKVQVLTPEGVKVVGSGEVEVTVRIVPESAAQPEGKK